MKRCDNLLELEEYYLKILESLYDPVIIISADSTITYVNQAYESHFNISVKKVTGKKLREIEPQSRILEVLKDGVERINDFSYVESLGREVYANITPLKKGKELVGVATIMKDISETTYLQAELIKYKEYSELLQQQINDKNFNKLKSNSLEMQKSVDLAKRISKTDATVVLYGESGVGKEVFAKAIHESSNRSNKPFVALNMGSIPEELFESELLGYVEGSFTGANKEGKKGIFEIASGGTLFLDELSELSLNNQTKLLRVIQERQFYKLGSTKLQKIDIRIICATNRDLMKAIKIGEFREDLYYRLSVLPITIPPLRKRSDDIKYISKMLLNELRQRYKKEIFLLPETLEKLKEYSWPGNVRELYNLLERLVALSYNTYIDIDDLPEYIRFNYDVKNEPTEFNDIQLEDLKLKDLIEKTEKHAIDYALKSSVTRSEAIEKLGISRKSFYDKLKKYQIM